MTSNSEIKLVALATIELRGISQSVSRKFHCIENLENFVSTYCKHFNSHFKPEEVGCALSTTTKHYTKFVLLRRLIHHDL